MAVEGHHVIALYWSMLTLTFILTLLRLYTRISRRGASERLPLWSDIFVILAWMSFATQGCLNTVLYVGGFFDPNTESSAPEEGAHTTPEVLRIFWIENVLYLNCMYAVKGSMCCLYLEFFPNYMKWTRRVLWGTIGLVIASWIWQFFLCLLWCIPVSKNWSMDENVFCTCWMSEFVTYFSLIPHFITDVIIYCLPLPVIFTLSVSWRIKWGLAVVFSIGFLCIFFAIALLVVAELTESFAGTYICQVFEQTWAVVVACLPAVRAWIGQEDKFKLRKQVRERYNADDRDADVGIMVVGMRNSWQRHAGDKPKVVTGGRWLGSLSSSQTASVGGDTLSMVDRKASIAGNKIDEERQIEASAAV